MLGEKQHASTEVSRPENDLLLSTSTSHLVNYCEKDLNDHRTLMLAAHRAYRSSLTEAT